MFSLLVLGYSFLVLVWSLSFFHHLIQSASQFAELQQEFNSIIGIDGVLKLFAKLIKDLKNAPTEHAKAIVLFEFSQAAE